MNQAVETKKGLTAAHLAAEEIKKIVPDFKPRLGIVLGSGSGEITKHLTDAISINYDRIPGFPKLTVHGHAGRMVLGYFSDTPVICLQGRAHTYEGTSFEVVKTYVRVLKLLGCEYFLATNASGSMQERIPPGELLLITDHINLQPSNPLVGPNDDEFGPRFLPLDNAYDKETRVKLLQVAEKENIPLHQGVYLSVLGPQYETPAEIRAFRFLGADAVGMSTVPEILVANHCGMKVAAIAIISNYATGLTEVSHCHDQVLFVASQATQKLSQLIRKFAEELALENH